MSSDEGARFEGVIADCRRSQYLDVAEALKHFADYDTNQFGPVYDVYETPKLSSEEAKRLLWAFRAGREFGAEYDSEETDE